MEWEWSVAQRRACQNYLTRLASRDPAELEREWYIGVGSDCMTCAASSVVPDISHLSSVLHAIKTLNITMGDRAYRGQSRALIEVATRRVWDLVSASVNWAKANQPEPPKLKLASLWDLAEKQHGANSTYHDGWKGFYPLLQNGQLRISGAISVWEAASMQATCGGHRERCLYHILRGSGYGGSVDAIEGIHHDDLFEVVEGSLDYQNIRIYGAAIYGQTLSPSIIQSQHTDPIAEAIAGGVQCQNGRCGSYGYSTIDNLLRDVLSPGQRFPIVARAVGWGVGYIDEDKNYRTSDQTITELYILTESKHEYVWATYETRLGIKRPEKLVPAHITPYYKVDINWQRIGQELADYYEVPCILVRDYEDIDGIDKLVREGGAQYVQNVIHPNLWLKDLMKGFTL